MPTSLAVRFPGKTIHSLFLAAFAAIAVLLSVLAVLYQKTVAPFSSRGVASLWTSASCSVPAQGSLTNERKQLFVSCAGFLD